MNKPSALISAIQNEQNPSYTTNGARTNASTLNKALDFFYVGPVAKQNPQDAVNLFKAAYFDNREVSLRVLQWVRDIRGGAGARQAFRDCLSWLISYAPKDAMAVLNKTALIGRWDDLLIVFDQNSKPVQRHVISLIKKALANGDGLCAKWMPRKGAVASILQTSLKLSPKAYRVLIVGLSNTVEQKMCARDWSEVNYSHVPSVAFARYRKAFKRHDENRYKSFVEAANKGEVKINASAIFPHDVVKLLPLSNYYARQIDETTRTSINAQWKNLPDYLAESGETGLVIADVSGSMNRTVGGSTNAMHVCIALAMYMAERARGAFKDTFITFSERPQLQKLTGTDIVNRYQQLITAKWDMNTNLEAAFKLILDTAVKHHLAQADMPMVITIISDMEFDACTQGRSGLDMIRKKFELAGYKMPRVVFWNVAGRIGNAPATGNQKDVALISGYSPAILSQVFNSEDLTPVNLMLKAVMSPRYDIELV
jgi:hypothetical protein